VPWTLVVLAAQDTPPPDLRVHVNLVNVSFTVRDANGALQPDLQRDNFTLLENGVPQQIQLFSRYLDQPLTLGVVLDLSGSQSGLSRQNIETATSFLKRVLKPTDRAFMAAFKFRVKLITDFTSSIPELEDGLINVARLYRDAPFLGLPKTHHGASPVHDAIYSAARETLQDVTGRKALVMISDGEDTTSRHSLGDVIEMLQSADTVFYALNSGHATGVKVARVLAPQLLLFRSHMDRIAAETGGQEWKVSHVRLEDAFHDIEEELRTQYAIGYVSSNAALDGTFRKIEIRVDRPGMTVRARRGYTAKP